MVVGLITWELHLEGCQSLKDKRRFNVSAAETDHQDLWQRAELSACIVTTDRRHAEEVLRSADRLVEGANGARILDTATNYY